MLNDFIYSYNLKLKRRGGFVNKLFAVAQVFLSFSIYVVACYRISCFFNSIYLFPVAKLFWMLNFILFKVDLDCRSIISGGIYFPHPFCIVIGRDVRIKGNLKALHCTTIGGSIGKSKAGDLRFTQLVCDGSAFLGAGSSIFGPVKADGNLFLGANAMLTRDTVGDTFVLAINDFKAISDDMRREFIV